MLCAAFSLQSCPETNKLQCSFKIVQVITSASNLRESLYRLLPQTTPENISKNFEQYSIDPVTRYPNLNVNYIRPHQVCPNTPANTSSTLQTFQICCCQSISGHCTSSLVRYVICSWMVNWARFIWKGEEPHSDLEIGSKEVRCGITFSTP